MSKPQPEIDYSSWEISALAEEMQKTGVALGDAKAEAAALQNKWDLLRKTIIPNKLDEMGIDSVRVKGVGTVSKRYDAYCNVVPGAAPELYKWLEENGKGDVIKPSVNPSTMKALMKEMFNAGEEIPEAFVVFNPYTYVSITSKG